MAGQRKPHGLLGCLGLLGPCLGGAPAAKSRKDGKKKRKKLGHAASQREGGAVRARTSLPGGLTYEPYAQERRERQSASIWDAMSEASSIYRSECTSPRSPMPEVEQAAADGQPVATPLAREQQRAASLADGTEAAAASTPLDGARAQQQPERLSADCAQVNAECQSSSWTLASPSASPANRSETISMDLFQAAEGTGATFELQGGRVGRSGVASREASGPPPAAEFSMQIGSPPLLGESSEAFLPPACRTAAQAAPAAAGAGEQLAQAAARIMGKLAALREGAALAGADSPGLLPEPSWADVYSALGVPTSSACGAAEQAASTASAGCSSHPERTAASPLLQQPMPGAELSWEDVHRSLARLSGCAPSPLSQCDSTAAAAATSSSSAAQELSFGHATAMEGVQQAAEGGLGPDASGSNPVVATSQCLLQAAAAAAQAGSEGPSAAAGEAALMQAIQLAAAAAAHRQQASALHAAISAILHPAGEGADDTSASKDNFKRSPLPKPQLSAPSCASNLTLLSDITNGVYNGSTKGGADAKRPAFDACLANPAFSDTAHSPSTAMEALLLLQLARSPANEVSSAYRKLAGPGGALHAGLTHIWAMPVGAATPLATGLLQALLTPFTNPLFSGGSSRSNLAQGATPRDRDAQAAGQGSSPAVEPSPSLRRQSSSWASTDNGAQESSAAAGAGDTVDGKPQQPPAQAASPAALPAAAVKAAAATPALVPRLDLQGAMQGTGGGQAAAGCSPAGQTPPEHARGSAQSSFTSMASTTAGHTPGPLSARRPRPAQMEAAVRAAAAGHAELAASRTLPRSTLNMGPLAAHNPLHSALRSGLARRSGSPAKPALSGLTSGAATQPAPAASGMTVGSGRTETNQAAAEQGEAISRAAAAEAEVSTPGALPNARSQSIMKLGEKRAGGGKMRSPLHITSTLQLPGLQVLPQQAPTPRSDARRPYIFSPPPSPPPGHYHQAPGQAPGMSPEKASEAAAFDALDTVGSLVTKMVPGFKFSSPAKADRPCHHQDTSAAAAAPGQGFATPGSRPAGAATPPPAASPAYTFTPPAKTPPQDATQLAQAVEASVLSAIRAIQGCLDKMQVTPGARPAGQEGAEAIGVQRRIAPAAAAAAEAPAAGPKFTLQLGPALAVAAEVGNSAASGSGLGDSWEPHREGDSRASWEPEAATPARRRHEGGAAERLPWEESAEGLQGHLLSPPMTEPVVAKQRQAPRGGRHTATSGEEGAQPRAHAERFQARAPAAGSSRPAGSSRSLPHSPLARKVQAILDGSRRASPGGKLRVHHSSPGALPPLHPGPSHSTQAALAVAQPRRFTDGALPEELFPPPESPTLPSSGGRSMRSSMLDWSQEAAANGKLGRGSAAGRSSAGRSSGPDQDQAAQQQQQDDAADVPVRKSGSSASGTGTGTRVSGSSLEGHKPASRRSAEGQRASSRRSAEGKRKEAEAVIATRRLAGGDAASRGQDARQQADVAPAHQRSTVAVGASSGASAMKEYADALAQFQPLRASSTLHGGASLTAGTGAGGALGGKASQPKHARGKSRLSMASVDWTALQQGGDAPQAAGLPSTAVIGGQPAKARRSLFKVASPFRRQMQQQRTDEL